MENLNMAEGCPLIAYSSLSEFCIRATEFLNDECGLDVGVKYTNHKRTHFDGRKGHIAYGHKNVAHWAGAGFLDYHTVRHVWREAGLPERARPGLESVWRIVLHEYAHALQRDGEATRSRPHGPSFKKELAELIEIYPPDEFQHLMDFTEGATASEAIDKYKK